MNSTQGLPIISFDSLPAWEEWLEHNHGTSKGLWMMIAKRDSGASTVSYPQAVEGAICFGWIDGQKGAFDERFWLQRFTPRGLRSRWSRINRERAQTLSGAGRLRPAGSEAIARAKSDGSWAKAYEGQRRAEIPEDLRMQLDERPRAKAFFEALDSANRYAILYRIEDAKRPQTRARRIAKYLAMLEAGEKIHS